MDRISPHELTLDPDIQSRAQLDMTIIQEYADDMRNGAQFPPIKAIRENGSILVYSGFHRVHAAIKAGVGILADIKDGTFQDAQWLAAAENQDHGLRRTNADKRRAAEKALIARPQTSDREIARHCGISAPMVGSVRAELALSVKDLQIDERIVTRNGKTYIQDTSNIGKPQEPEIKDLSGTQPPPLFSEQVSTEHFERFKQGNYSLGLDEFGDPLPSQDAPLAQEPTRSRAMFNETNDNIEWAAWSWNPVTGCKHGCPYCYARDIANRFYPQGFEPTFHPDRLSAPINTKIKGLRWESDQGYKSVFVCSMADLFGDWVPGQWITSVMDVVSATPQWTYIFLTKNPKRLAAIDWPTNAWVGTSVDTQGRVKASETAFAQFDATVKFLSCEPLRGPLQFSSLSMFDWVLIGGQSKTSQEPEQQPQWEWVESLHQQARQARCKVYWKTNLTVRPREYPG